MFVLKVARKMWGREQHRQTSDEMLENNVFASDIFLAMYFGVIGCLISL